MWRAFKLFITVVFIGLITASCTEKKEEIKPGLFGKLETGQEIYLHKISNGNGVSAEIINYGAIVKTLKVPDKTGKAEDVILGFDSLDGYVQDQSFQGAIVGRYGNRIAEGKFSLEGNDYQLSVNSGENHLHGGFKGFYKAVWNVDAVSDSSIKLSLTSPDGDEGYPGKVKISVTYTITGDNGLRIDYSGTTDKTTILNPTNHCYFNLTGNPENTILDHELMINADKFTPVNDKLIPTGELKDVEGTPMDFSKPKKIGRDIAAGTEQLEFGFGYDHNWVLNDYNGEVREAATLYEPVSGRLLTVETDQPGLQFYSGNFLDGSLVGKGGQAYEYRTALCLEAQAYPDSPNHPEFPSVVLKPGEEYTQTTIYKFSTK